MSTTVSYKGETLTTVSNATKTLETAGMYMEDDLTLVDVSGGGSTLGTKNITANDTYDASDDDLDGYSQVTVAVSASAVDTGTKSITANGTHDVVGYASASVSVPNSYSASDEGKVVDNGALVAQTAHADVTPATSDQTIDTTTNNSIKVKGDADLVAANIKKDVEIFGVTGSYEGGGGGTATIGLLTTINITSPVATITYDLPALAADYGMVWVVCDNLVLSAKDYMYFCVMPSNQNPSDSTGYLQTTTFNSTAICLFSKEQTVNNITLPGSTGSSYGSGTTNRIARVSGTPNVLKGKLYASGTRFNSGTLYVYGRTA